VVLLLNEVHLPLYKNTPLSVPELGEIALSIAKDKECRVCVVASDVYSYYIEPDQTVTKHYKKPSGGIVVTNETFSAPVVKELSRQRIDQRKLTTFVAGLNNGLQPQDMDPQTRSWWFNRY